MANLEQLDLYDKETCLRMLEEADFSTLYDALLKVQTKIYLPQEAAFLAREPAWQTAQNVLDLGCGNGAYLKEISNRFSDKRFVGMDKDQPFMELAQKLSGDRLQFRQGDAEILYSDLEGKFDVVTMHLLLQHMQHPKLALEAAHKYLKPGGYVIITEAYDSARKDSHLYSAFEETTRLHNEKNKSANKGNRKYTLELLNELTAQGPMSALFEPVYSSLDAAGNVLEYVVKWEKQEELRLYYTGILLYMSMIKKAWEMPVDIQKGFDELQSMIEDKSAWSYPGMHHLILKAHL
jgi:ubiquinone/menaquinone biosynthesis C-methylase UbiE